MTDETSLTRVSIPELDAILGRKWNVLDDGFVRVVDYLGSDAAIVQAARVSYGAGTKAVQEDRALIRYLMRHRHSTPFEMCEVKLHVRVPMDTWRQWIRHRTANVNEYSTRYSVAIDSAGRTEASGWRRQAASAKQGSEGTLPEEVGTRLSAREAELHALAREVYAERLAAGVAREQARKDLPLSTYTEAYWKVDLHNLLHFLSLRMERTAQEEIRAYASVIGNEIVARWCPVAWQAFLDYRVNSITLSAQEAELVRSVVAQETTSAIERAVAWGWLATDGTTQRPSRERSDAERKLSDLGLAAPWGPPRS